jgi:hypothetical protein
MSRYSMIVQGSDEDQLFLVTMSRFQSLAIASFQRSMAVEVIFLEFTRSRLGSDPRLLACRRGSHLHEIVLIIKNFDTGDRSSLLRLQNCN